MDTIVSSVPSPGDGGGLKHLGDWTLTPVIEQWAGRDHTKQRYTTPDGRNRPPARIDVSHISDKGDAQTWYLVYRASNYLGAVDSLAKAKDLAQRNVRLAEALLAPEDFPRNGVDGGPAWAMLTKEEHRFSRDWTHENKLYDQSGQRIKRTGPEFMKKYEGMSLDQLMIEYNKLVVTARAIGLDSLRSVSKFPNETAALEKILAAESSIRARQTSEKAVKQEPKNGPTPREVPPDASRSNILPAPKKEDTKMATTAKKAAKKAAPKKAAAKKGAKKAAAAPKGPKVYERPAGKKGEFTAKLNTLPGTKRDTLALFLFENLGKMVEVGKVTKAVYGKADAPGLNNVANGLKGDIEAAKVSYHIKREGGAIGLFTGSGK